ncbi:MAG: hypothetical protein AAFW84_24645 [Cyanobacteria bacterium J06635_15]
MGAKKSSNNSIGERLRVSLTQGEIVQLLDALVQGLPSELLEKALSELSSDTQKTIRQILTLPKSDTLRQAPQTPPTSLAKLSQTWSEHWQEWNDIVWAASEEDGKYIEQEASWEPPYFDEYAFAEDLDKAAQKMRSLVPVAFENGFIPDDGFAPALIEAESEVASSLPEWMEIVDGISLGEHITYCLLQWEWLDAKEQGQDAFQFAKRIRQIESTFSLMGLDDNALIAFLCELPATAQQNLLSGLTNEKESHSWRTVLGNTYSPWHIFYMEAINQFAPDRYLDNLRATISQKWSNGLPVIEDLLAHNNYAESLTIIQKTLAALLKSRHRSQPWTPETSLLVTLVGGFYHGEESFEQEKTLLSYFQQAAEGLGQTEQANVLKIQQIALEHCFDWQTIFQTFAEIPISKSTYRALFQSWRDHVIQRAIPQSWGYDSRQSSEPGWIHWLLDSIADTQKGTSWFQKQVTKWLTSLSGDRKDLGDAYGLLRLLTKDLQAIQGKKRRAYPTFYEVVIRVDELSASDDASRQSYLQQFAPDNLWKRVMDYWKTHLQTFVPDPKAAHKSDYTQHARWMAALKELAPDAYEQLLAQWHTDHIRRSNLWKAMKQAGL